MRKYPTKNQTRRKTLLSFAANPSAALAVSLSADTGYVRPARKKRSKPHPSLEKIGGMDEKVREFVHSYLNLAERGNIVLRTSRTSSIPDSGSLLKGLVNLKLLNEIRELNRFLATANTRLADNGLVIVCAETKYFRKQRILRHYPKPLNHTVLAGDYLVKRVVPKLPLTSLVYRSLFGERERAMSRTEAMGRLFAAGFEVLEYRFIDGILYMAARKVAKPLFERERQYGIIFRMPRLGKDGKLINVYKIRTMHSYSEFIQKYVYDHNSLCDGGKLKDDFRVSTIGRFVRKYWIDELPMLFNWIKGDLKLVGVRPLSAHYLSLYSEDLKAVRLRHKPGLIPPFYADMPVTLEEIQDSELRYLKAYERHPVLTDLRYFFKAAWNILLRSARSK